MPNTSWPEWEKYVLTKLDDLNREVSDLKADSHKTNSRILKELENIRLEVHTIKIKSGLIGALVGSISSMAAATAYFFHR